MILYKWIIPTQGEREKVLLTISRNCMHIISNQEKGEILCSWTTMRQSRQNSAAWLVVLQFSHIHNQMQILEVCRGCIEVWSVINAPLKSSPHQRGASHHHCPYHICPCACWKLSKKESLWIFVYSWPRMIIVWKAADNLLFPFHLEI